MPLKPICHPCQQFYRPEKNGFYFIEGQPTGPGHCPPGTEAAERWIPYKLWVGDLWRCHGCGHRIISGFGRGPIAEQHEPDFAELIERYQAKYQVNDC